MDPDDPFSNDWNSIDLRPPEMEFFESTKINVTCVRKAVINEHRANQTRHLLFVEMTLLSKFFEARKNKYRSDKGFKTIAKIDKAVNRIHLLDLKTVTTVLKANLSAGKFVPSKQVCQWLLIKLLSYGLLLNRTIECCKYSSSMLTHRLRTGHSWTEIVVAMAMVSRIWSLSTYLVKKCCFSYQKLVTIKDDLTSNPKDSGWIFTNYQFPQNLEKWINQPHNFPSFSQDPEIIPQSSQRKPSVSKNTKHHAEAVKKIRKIESAECLKLFILEERKLRRLKKHCISKNLNAVQWEEVNKKLIGCYKMLNASNDKVTLIERIRKKIKKWLLNC